MRIAFVVNTFHKRFFEQTIKTFPPSIETEMIDVADCYSAKSWLLPSREFLKRLRILAPDVVYTDYPHYSMWHAKFCQLLERRRIARIAHLHGDWWTEFYHWFSGASTMDRLLAAHRYYFTYTGLELADVVAPVCKALKEVILQHLPSKPTIEVYQGIDPNLFYEESGTRLKHPNVCIIQNHNIWPKVEGLLQFANVVKRMPEVHFYVAGGQPIGQSYLQLVSQTFAPFPNVHMLGSVPYPSGVRKLLTSADVYLLASGLDMCPTSVLEASAMQKPVVASRVGGVPEIVSEGHTGYTIPNGHVDAWVRTLRGVLENKSLAAKLGKNGRRWVLENFTLKRVGERMLGAVKMAFRT